MQWQNAQLSPEAISHSSVLEVETKSNDSSSIENIRGSDRVSSIDPQAIDKLYSQIKATANAALDASNIENKDLKPYDYLKNNIEEIADYPIEVSIAPEEVNTAILYNSLGINFLDVKRLEVRMDLFEKAQDEVNANKKSGHIRTDQALELSESIKGSMASLQEQKQALLERKHITKNEDELIKQLQLNQAIKPHSVAV